MRPALACACADQCQHIEKIENRWFFRCSKCAALEAMPIGGLSKDSATVLDALAPMPRRGARLLNETRFLESLREQEANDAPPDDRYPPIVGVLITLSVFALTVYVGWHVCVWMGRA